jgi:hypothetical protein
MGLEAVVSLTWTSTHGVVLRSYSAAARTQCVCHASSPASSTWWSISLSCDKMEDAGTCRTGQICGDTRYGLTPTESQITGVASKPHPYRVRGCKLELTRISQQYTQLKRHRHLSQHSPFQLHPNLTSTVLRWERHKINGKFESTVYWSNNSSLSSTTPLCDRAFSQNSSRRPSTHESLYTRSIQRRRELSRCIDELDRIGEGRLNHVCEG